MKFNDATLLISCAESKQFPATTQFEVVCVGKSNVGKSTLINGLAHRKNLAYVGQRPGKTRLVNFYEFSEDLMVVDVPGYGFANRSMKEQERYAELMEDYFSIRPQLKAMIILVDCRRGLSEDDQMMLEIGRNLKLAQCIAISKSDKVSFSALKSLQLKLKSLTKVPVFTFHHKDMDAFEQLRNQIDIWMK